MAENFLKVPGPGFQDSWISDSGSRLKPEGESPGGADGMTGRSIFCGWLFICQRGTNQSTGGVSCPLFIPPITSSSQVIESPTQE